MAVVYFGGFVWILAKAAARTGPAQGVTWVFIGIALGVALLHLAAGIGQWKRPTTVVPIIALLVTLALLLLAAYGVIAAISATGQAAPAWLLVFQIILPCINLVLHAVGYRGSKALDRTREAIDLR